MTKFLCLTFIVLQYVIPCVPQNVRCMPIPDNYPYLKDIPRHFSVTADGLQMALYNDTSHWGGTIDYGSFEMRRDCVVKMRVEVDEDIRTLEVLPKSDTYEIEEIGSRSVALIVRQPGNQITLIVNGDPKTGHVLHIFCDEFQEGTQPTGYCYDKNSQTHFFGAGYHCLSALLGSETLKIRGRQRIYIAPGAVVEGQLLIQNGNGAKIYGGGIVVRQKGNMINVYNSHHSSVEGITVHGLSKHGWQTIIDNSNYIHFTKMKIFNPHYASVDGIDVVKSSHCIVDHSFIRANDDAVAIKGLGDNVPSEGPVCTDLVFDHLQLWNDCNNCFGIGAETRCREFSDIRLTNSSILFSYDDPFHHTLLDERAALNICSLHGTFFRNILFDNITVYHCERLIGLGFKPDFWFGDIAGYHEEEGGISNVTFSNIQSLRYSDSILANKILLYDWHKKGTPDKLINNIFFENVVVAGEKVTDANNILFDLHPAEGHDLKKELFFK